jgi:hypothetical protein
LIREPSIEATQQALEHNRINVVEHQDKAKPLDDAMTFFQDFLKKNFPQQFNLNGNKRKNHACWPQHRF